MKNKVTHTPTPFVTPLRAKHYGPEGDSDVLDAQGGILFAGLSRQEAEFIVRAVHSHENLVYHLHTLASYKHEGEKHPGSFKDCSGEVCGYIKTVIAQAEGVQS